MTQAAAFRESDVRRAIKATEGAGLSVAGIEITRDGMIRVLTGAATAPQVLDEFAAWEASLGRDKP